MDASTSTVADLLVHRGGPLAVDASKVRRLTGQGLQVLLSAKKTWAEDGQPLTVVEPSEAFSERLQLFGVSAELEGAA